MITAVNQENNNLFAKFRWLTIVLLLFGNLYIWGTLWQFSGQNLMVAFLDVGQGDAILIRAPGGRTVLIDGGPGKNILRRIASELPFFARSLDLLIETHPDTDHAGGLPDVVGKYTVRGILKPCLNADNPYDQALDKIASEKKVKEICATAGQIIDLGSGAKLEILYAGEGERTDTNGASVVVRLYYGATSFLLMGDATVKEEKYLVYYAPEKLDADVYKVSHHGSRESNDEQFLQLVSPQISVISVGAGNRYGH
ncbi:MAG: MBL fold metallo-hydrolase, partial [Candidatus Vogelbacteria bacterium]|nr:MBL fold metallo-hydrolase [Candidatus Vogelbacteria bacterium]